MTGGEGELLFHQLVDFFLHHLLIQQLARGDAVHLGAQRRDAVFIFVLHARLPRHRRADQVVAQDEIGSGKQVTDGHGAGDTDTQRRHPRPDRHMPDLVAAGENQDMRLGTFSEYAVFRPVGHGSSPRGCALGCANWK